MNAVDGVIEPIELRHNSYYLLNGEVHKFNINAHVMYELKWFSPIPLTPEMLEAAGWGKSDEHEMGTNMLNDSNDGLYFDYYLKTLRMEIGDNDEIKMPHIKYLHQLQNLYFALTGEELPISIEALTPSC